MEETKKKIEFIQERKNSGITLIALVLTIVILIILAITSIFMLTGDTKRYETKTNANAMTTSIEGEKEKINTAYNQISKLKNEENTEESDTKITAEELQKEFDKENIKATAQESETDMIKVTYTETKNVYMLNCKTGMINQ